MVSGLGLGRPKVEEIVAFWPALIPKSEVNTGGGAMAKRKLIETGARALRR